LGAAGRQRLKIAFDEAHAGSSNAGQTLVLEDGVTAKPIQVTAVDMQYIEARHLNREEVCGVFDVAPPMVHILDRATFSNISAQMRAFYRDTMEPVIQLLQSVMDKYVGAYWSRPNMMRFATDDVIRGDFEVRMEAAHKALSTGVMTPNEARTLVGLNRFDDPKADELYANSAIQQLGSPMEQIRMTGDITGVTPDGVAVQATSTPVADPAGGPPRAVPAASAKPRPAPGGPQPDNVNASSKPKPKFYRQIKGAMGRGKTKEQIEALALTIFEKCESAVEIEELLHSVRLVYEEKVMSE